MPRRLESIDLSSEIDVLYLYKNASSFPTLMRELSSVRICDINIALLCYGILESSICTELGILYNDPELLYIRSSPNAASRCQEPRHFYLQNLESFLPPLLCICNKQVLDLVFFVYQKTGVNHLELIFQTFYTEPDLLLELHLLMARILFSKPFDMTAIKRTINNLLLPGEVLGKKCVLADFGKNVNKDVRSVEFRKDNSLDVLPGAFSQECSGKDAEVKLVTEKIECNSSIVKESGCQRHGMSSAMAMTYAQHMDSARNLIINLKGANQAFLLDNITTFLSMKFDVVLWQTLLPCINNQHFFIHMNKFKQLPFTIFAGVDIKSLLLCRIRRMERSARYKHYFGSADEYSMKVRGLGDLADQTEHQAVCKDVEAVNQLSKTEWYMNPFTLKYFVEFIIETLNDMRIPIHHFVLISKNIDILANIEEPYLYRLFKVLLRCRINKISTIIGEGLIENIQSIINRYYRTWREEPIGSSTEKWAIHTGATEDDVSRFTNTDENDVDASADDVVEKSICEILYIKEDSRTKKCPSEEQSKLGATIKLIEHPELAAGYEHRAMLSIIESIKEKGFPEYAREDSARPTEKNEGEKSLIEEINQFLILASEDNLLKERLLDNLHFIDGIEPETKAAISQRLLSADGMKWRYRKKLLLQASLLRAWYDGTDAILKNFVKDRVYLVRKLAKHVCK